MRSLVYILVLILIIFVALGIFELFLSLSMLGSIDFLKLLWWAGIHLSKLLDFVTFKGG